MSSPPTPPIKLNLGCGRNLRSGYINVDRFGAPDVLWDLEEFPWPWDANTVDEVLMYHVLEHLGADCDVYFKIVKELYRVCRHGAIIRIVVPHPRHDDFLADPTHVRAILPAGWMVFSKAKNREWIAQHGSNTPLGLYLDVDFEVADAKYVLDPSWAQKLHEGSMTREQIWTNAQQILNVIKEIEMDVRVIKEPAHQS